MAKKVYRKIQIDAIDLIYCMYAKAQGDSDSSDCALENLVDNYSKLLTIDDYYEFLIQRLSVFKDNDMSSEDVKTYIQDLFKDLVPIPFHQTLKERVMLELL